MDNKTFKNFVALALPLVVQNVILSSVNLLDNIMVGQLGETALAGVSMANRVFNLYNIMMFGLCSGAIIFFSQYWGKQDSEGIKNVMSLTLIVALATAAVFFAASQLFTNEILTALCGKENVQMIDLGCKYLRIMSVSYVFFALIFVISSALKAIEKPRLGLYAAVISLGLNAVLNYCLIFGRFGMPRLEVRGAALATLIARAVELCALLVLSHRYKAFIYPNPKRLFRLPAGFVAKCISTSIMVFFNETFWALGITVYGAVFARMGENVAAAHGIVGTAENFLSSLIFGTSAAATVMIGKEIGSKNIDGVKQTVGFFIRTSFILGAVTGVIGFSIAPFIVSMFNFTQSSREISVAMLRVLAIYMPIRSFVMTGLVGIIRAGGDTRFCMTVDVGGLWCIGVPLAFICAFVLKLDAPVVYAAVLLEEPIKSVFAMLRIKSGKWINDLVNE